MLDGWWAEAYDGTNGWAIDGAVDADEEAQDARHAEALYDLLESEVVPLFYERDADGVPLGWVERMRSSLRTLAPRFVRDPDARGLRPRRLPSRRRPLQVPALRRCGAGCCGRCGGTARRTPS